MENNKLSIQVNGKQLRQFECRKLLGVLLMTNLALMTMSMNFAKDCHNELPY